MTSCCYLIAGLEKFEANLKTVKDECDLAVKIADNLLFKISPESKVIIDKYYANQELKAMKPHLFGETSFGKYISNFSYTSYSHKVKK